MTKEGIGRYMSVGSVVEAARRRGVPIARAFQVSNVERYVRRMNAPPEFSKAYHLQAIEQAYKAQKYRIDPFITCSGLQRLEVV